MTERPALQIALTWYRLDEASPVEIEAAVAAVGATFGSRLTHVRVVGDDERPHARTRRPGTVERLMSRTTRDANSSVRAFTKVRGRKDDPPVAVQISRLAEADGSPYALHVTHDLTEPALDRVPQLCEAVVALGDWHSGIGTIQPIVNHRFRYGHLTALVPTDTVPAWRAFKEMCTRFAADPSSLQPVGAGHAVRSVLRWNAYGATMTERVLGVLTDAGAGDIGEWTHFTNGALWTVDDRDDRMRAAAALHAAGLMHDSVWVDPEDLDDDAAASPF